MRIKTVLVLDEDKLTYYHNDTTVYWRDVTGIDYKLSSRYFFIEEIILSLRNHQKIVINTRLIAGLPTHIYKCIAEYYEQCS